MGVCSLDFERCRPEIVLLATRDTYFQLLTWQGCLSTMSSCSNIDDDTWIAFFECTDTTIAILGYSCFLLLLTPGIGRVYVSLYAGHFAWLPDMTKVPTFSWSDSLVYGRLCIDFAVTANCSLLTRDLAGAHSTNPRHVLLFDVCPPAIPIPWVWTLMTFAAETP